MLATVLHFLKGTPYIYQGEELGMTNYPFTSLEESQDVEVFNAYQELVIEQKLLTHKEMMKGICANSRDNARTPMQWDDSENADFTTGTPWMKVNPNYQTINAKQQIQDSSSIFHYYQQLIHLRHTMPIIAYGKYQILEEEHPDLYIYTREYEDEKLLVIGNFSDKEYEYNLPQQFENADILISNDNQFKQSNLIHIQPYGTYVFHI